jgi:hypothetical protein
MAAQWPTNERQIKAKNYFALGGPPGADSA